MDIDSWIFNKKYFDPDLPRDAGPEPVHKVFWKDGRIPESVVKNDKDEEDSIIHPDRIWKDWGVVRKRKKNVSPLEYLVYTGLIPRSSFSTNKLSDRTQNKLMVLMKSIIPDQECIKKQVNYIYSHPTRFLAIADYMWGSGEINVAGSNIRSIHSPPKEDNIHSLEEEFLLSERIPIKILNKYIALSTLQRYSLLNSVIMNAPSCHSPLIVFRGKRYERYGLDNKNPGYKFVTNNIMSTSLNPEIARKFGAFVYVLYLAKNIPRLFMNLGEMEFILPTGLLLEFVSSELIEQKQTEMERMLGKNLIRSKIYRIKVLKVMKDV